jgi:adenosylcobinamide-GDP ribazoletransferase
VDLTGVPAAVQFLTRIPIRLRREPSLARAVPWFPVAGALVGAAVGGVAAGLWQVSTPLVAGTVAVLVGVYVTGAFHEDGLADVADAFAGGSTVERRLEILKDPRHGSYGVAALSGSILVRAVALGSMPGPAAMFWSAVAAHAAARGAAVVLMGTGRIARADGLGADYARGLSTKAMLAGLGAAVVLTVAALAGRFGWHIHLVAAAVAVLAAAAIGTSTIAWLAHRKIGGVTGDVLGAAEQITECLALVVLASWRLAGA